MASFEIAALAISVLALIGSIGAAIISWRTGANQNQLQERMVLLETERE